MININLEELKIIQLKILEDIKSICLQHGINYFIIGGTLIGAIRHKGFIPWDDDIDVGMPRDEYNKFKKIIKKYDEKYFFQDFDTEQNTFLPFGKLRLNGTQYIESNNKNIDMHKGIFVDVFPLDYTKTNNKIKIFIRYILKNYIFKLLLIRNAIYNKQNIRFRNRVIFSFTKLVPNKKKKKMYTYIVIGNKEKGNYLVNYFPRSFRQVTKEVINTENIFPTKEVYFENILVLAPKDYDYYLKSVFGNYMELPPIEKRVTHSPLKVIVEDYSYIAKYREGDV